MDIKNNLPTKHEAELQVKAFILAVEKLRKKHGVDDYICGAAILYGPGFRSIGISSGNGTNGFARLVDDVRKHCDKRLSQHETN